eukprot:scaffold154063_cov54-Attheya_sp.AAC.1
MPSILNNEKRTIYPSWNDRFRELVDFKAISGHANVVVSSGPLGGWVSNQRQAFRQLKEGPQSHLGINDCKN